MRHRPRPTGQMEAQCPAVRFAPVVIEIEHEGEHARVVVAKAVTMPRIAAARRIDRIVELVLGKAQEERSIARDAQQLHELERRRFRRVGSGGIEPGDAIAACADLPRTRIGIASRLRRDEAAGRIEIARMRPHRGNRGIVQGMGKDRVAVVPQSVDDAIHE